MAQCILPTKTHFAKSQNACILPEDLKNFYLMTDGFQMTWSVKIDGKSMCLSQLMPSYLADNPSFAESP